MELKLDEKGISDALVQDNMDLTRKLSTCVFLTLTSSVEVIFCIQAGNRENSCQYKVRLCEKSWSSCQWEWEVLWTWLAGSPYLLTSVYHNKLIN